MYQHINLIIKHYLPKNTPPTTDIVHIYVYERMYKLMLFVIAGIASREHAVKLTLMVYTLV